MNKKAMNDMITKQVAEQVAKTQKQGLVITGISVAGVGLISILANRKMLKKQQLQVEEIKDAVASRDDVLDDARIKSLHLKIGGGDARNLSDTL